MKKCPTCERTFEDSLKFCQMDGTPLVDFAETSSADSFMVNSSITDDDLNFGMDAGETRGTNVSPPSPFDVPTPSGYQSPSLSSPFKEPEPMFDEPRESFNQSPFGNSPMMQQSEWTPPPAPDANWMNQGIGQNTPFQPPIAGGQNQTLAIVSLVCGVLSIVCCWFSIFVGPAGLITGYIAKNKADENPAQFGGRGMALAGMITGGIGTGLGILFIILQILGTLF